MENRSICRPVCRSLPIRGNVELSGAEEAVIVGFFALLFGAMLLSELGIV